MRPIKVGQFAVSRGWGEFSISVRRADVITPKLVKERDGTSWKGRERFSQVNRADVIAVADTQDQIDALSERVKSIRGMYSARVQDARQIAERELMEALAPFASGTEAPSGGETHSGSTEGESPAPEGGDAQ